MTNDRLVLLNTLRNWILPGLDQCRHRLKMSADAVELVMDVREQCLVFRVKGERILCLRADEINPHYIAPKDPSFVFLEAGGWYASTELADAIRLVDDRMDYAFKFAMRPDPLEISTAA